MNINWAQERKDRIIGELEQKMDFYATQRDRAYAALQKCQGPASKAFARAWHQKYSEKFNQAYAEWQKVNNA